MAVRSLIIGVEKYPVLEEALAGDLGGTLDTAGRFRDWLITAKQVPAGNILFCSEPRREISTAGATWEEIRSAMLLLRDHAGDTAELYFFFSGHGYAQIGSGKQPT